MTQNELNTLTKEWQKRLRLLDWNVGVRIVPFADIEAYGHNHIQPRFKSCRIRLCDPAEVPVTWIGNKDLEVTVVHELLHLHAEPLEPCIKDNEPANTALEAMIELTAIALVAAKREAA